MLNIGGGGNIISLQIKPQGPISVTGAQGTDSPKSFDSLRISFFIRFSLNPPVGFKYFNHILIAFDLHAREPTALILYSF
jgi:hypothetical protein